MSKMLTKIIISLFMMFFFVNKVEAGNVASLFTKIQLESIAPDLTEYQSGAKYIRSRMSHYRGISASDKSAFIKSILKWSKHYGIDFKVITAVVETECSFNIKAKHPVVNIEVPLDKHWNSSKKMKTRADGAGVIFWLWKFRLVDIGIHNRKELLVIDNNIHAVCMVINYYKNKRRIKGSDSIIESALLRYYGVIRKDGKVLKTYPKRIYAKID